MNLEKLTLSKTEISELPKELNSLEKLEELNISGTYINKIPESLESITIDEDDNEEMEWE